MAAHAEKVIVNANAIHAQKPIPKVGEKFFCLRTWLNVGGGFSMEIRGRQSATIDFAVGGEGKCVYKHERSGHHICRQAVCEKMAQGIVCELGVTLDGLEVGHQTRLSGGVLVQEHHLFRHLGMG